MRVLVVQRAISHYRRGFYEALGKEVDLTVLHTRPTSASSATFNELTTSQWDFGGVQWQHGILSRMRHYDALVLPFNVRSITSVAIPLLPRTTPVVYWGLGDGTSQFANRVRRFLLKHVDALVLYSEGARQSYIRQGIPARMLFVAPNSLHVPDAGFTSRAAERSSLLVIGTLEARKRIDKVLKAFAEVYGAVPANVLLEIVGDGPELESLLQLARELRIDGRVRFHGRVTSGPKLAAILARALAAVSPNQAGLSVIHTAANGVPFVTRKDAITGGEIEFIIDGETGFLYASDDELAPIIAKLSMNPELSVAVGRQARDHYNNRHSIREMVAGFRSAVEYAVGRGS